MYFLASSLNLEDVAFYIVLLELELEADISQFVACPVAINLDFAFLLSDKIF